MIKASTIIAQLQAVLPTQTDLFSNADVTITSLTRSSTTITAVMSAAHGLVTGNFVNIIGAKTPITVSTITAVYNTGLSDPGSIVTVVTATDHDFTEGFDFTCEVAGADQAAYNGTFTILTVPNRRTFTYAITTQPVTPGTGTVLLLNTDSRGYNGRKQITNVNLTTFTYATTLTPASPAEGTPTFRGGARISGGISWERVRAAYTEKAPNNLWAFVVLGDNSISKSRRDTTDAVQTIAPGDAYRQRLIAPFSIYIYAPCVGDIAGREVRDQMEDVRVALYKSVLRVKFDSVLSETNPYVVSATGDRFVDYNGAYYIHEFSFETECDITYDDTVEPDYNVAFRDFSLVFEDPAVTDYDDIIMQTLDVSLDDDPI